MQRSRPAAVMTLVTIVCVTACGASDAASPPPSSNPGPSGDPGASGNAVAQVTIGPGPATLLVGTAQLYTATASNAQGTALAGRTVTWTTSDAGIAYVSSRGLVSAIASGTATLTATSEGKTATTTVRVNARPAYSSGRTVVIRVVGTGPVWGQEPIPGWPNAAPVKDGPDYSLYDLEIGRNATNQATYVALYEFNNWTTSLFALSAAQFAQYFTSSRVFQASVQPVGESSATLSALQTAVRQVLQREQPARLILSYSGHGGPALFFEGALTMPHAKQLLRFVRDAVPTVPLILDFSTNCNVGYFDFVMNFYDTADFLIASEKQVGGFDVSSVDINAYLAVLHDNVLHTFWRGANPTAAAFNAVVAARQGLWSLARAGISAGRVQQSIAVYDLSELNNLMNALAGASTFNAPVDIPRNSNDIGSYVYATRNAQLIGAFEKFRILYASDRDIVTWTDDARGFSVLSTTALQDFLRDR